MILALAGGVGGAKLAKGLAALCEPGDLTIVVNTGDDFVHLGFNISPDLDTVMYWLAAIHDRARGWGQSDETWQFMAAVERLGGPVWFKLGDRDLATHVERMRLLQSGYTLSEVTDHLCQRLGIRHKIAPMTDDAVRTLVHTDEGVLTFQDYFVRRQCAPRVHRLEYADAERARRSATFDQALCRDDLTAVIICPSNPLLSIDPILSVGSTRKQMAALDVPIVAVSPIIGGQAIKGPAAKILRELGRQPTSLEIARHYAGLIDGLLIDVVDAELETAIDATGVKPFITTAVMRTEADQVELAGAALKAASFVNERSRAKHLFDA